MAKLSIKGTSLAFGLTWGILVMLLGWAGIIGWAGPIVELIGSLYIGYSASFLGGVIGFIWGFVDGAIGGALVAVIYNLVVEKKKK